MLGFITLIAAAATTMIASTRLFVEAGQAVEAEDHSEVRQIMRLAGAALALQAVLWIAALEVSMAHVHFDLDDVARRMRRMRDEQLPLVLAAARSDLQRDGYLAQDRLFEAIVSAQLEMMRMLNEGRDDRFIGVTIGTFIGTVMVNTLAAAEDEAASLAAMYGALGRALDTYWGDNGAGVSTTMIEVAPLQSGRA